MDQHPLESLQPNELALSMNTPDINKHTRVNKIEDSSK